MSNNHSLFSGPFIVGAIATTVGIGVALVATAGIGLAIGSTEFGQAYGPHLALAVMAVVIWIGRWFRRRYLSPQHGRHGATHASTLREQVRQAFQETGVKLADLLRAFLRQLLGSVDDGIIFWLLGYLLFQLPGQFPYPVEFKLPWIEGYATLEHLPLAVVSLLVFLILGRIVQGGQRVNRLLHAH